MKDAESILVTLLMYGEEQDASGRIYRVLFLDIKLKVDSSGSCSSYT